jgi:transposase InsO family protein
MPFRESSPVEARIALFNEYDTGVFTVVELCRRHGISRETFYVWKARRESGDPRWFEERSHATRACPHATAPHLIERIVAERRKFEHFGPKKIKARLDLKEPGAVWPAASTIGDILKREGLVEAKAKRRRPIAPGEILAPATRPNEEWAIDFKGWFRIASGERCDPLTITDQASRYLIEVRIVDPTFLGVKGVLERVFGDAGLPEAMRSDNGSPFGSTGAGGLSRLSVYLLKLGIEPRYIPPGSPQDNGRHERMHRTLKAETTRTPAHHPDQQQVRFNLFRAHYNEERPHEALGQTTPASHWRSSARAMPSQIEEPWYDAAHQVRRVRQSGEIKWQGSRVFIGEALSGEPVGLLEHESGGHLVRFCGRDLGIIDRQRRFQCFAPPRARLRPGTGTVAARSISTAAAATVSTPAPTLA